MSIKIAGELAFAWWVPYVLKKCDRIVYSINPRVKKATHKFGINIPTSYDDYKRLDKENGNTFWIDVLKKEMKDVGIAFKILEEDEHLPVGYKKSSGHYNWLETSIQMERWLKVYLRSQLSVKF